MCWKHLLPGNTHRTPQNKTTRRRHHTPQQTYPPKKAKRCSMSHSPSQRTPIQSSTQCERGVHCVPDRHGHALHLEEKRVLIRSSHQAMTTVTGTPTLQGKHCSFKRVQNTAAALHVPEDAKKEGSWSCGDSTHRSLAWRQKEGGSGWRNWGGPKAGQRPVPQGFRQPWQPECPRQRCALGFSTCNSLTCRQDTKSIQINKYPKIPTDWFLTGKGV